MSIKTRITVLASLVVALGTSALTLEAAPARSSSPGKMCTPDCSGIQGCDLCAAQCDEYGDSNCQYSCGGTGCPK